MKQAFGITTTRKQIGSAVEFLSEKGQHASTRKVSVQSMRKHQLGIFRDFRDSRYFVLQQPPGAGKSTTIKFVHAPSLANDLNRKVIIAVPQLIIARTFRTVDLNYDGIKLRWEVGHDLCDDDPTGSKTKALLKFLQRKNFRPNDPSDRVLLCSHATLAACKRYMREKEEMSDDTIAACFDNTTLVVDEAHHVQVNEDDDVVTSNPMLMLGAVETANQIGDSSTERATG